MLIRLLRHSEQPLKEDLTVGLLQQNPLIDYTKEKNIEHRRYLLGEELERLNENCSQPLHLPDNQ